MIRAPGARSDKFFCKPRASGDDPHRSQFPEAQQGVNPARAGMIPRAYARIAHDGRKPRASGDDPRAGLAALIDYV